MGWLYLRESVSFPPCATPQMEDPSISSDNRPPRRFYAVGAGADASVCHRPNSLPCGSLQVENQPMPGTGIDWSASPPSSLTRAAPALMSSTSK